MSTFFFKEDGGGEMSTPTSGTHPIEKTDVCWLPKQQHLFDRNQQPVTGTLPSDLSPDGPKRAQTLASSSSRGAPARDSPPCSWPPT